MVHISPDCATACGLGILPGATFLELGNREKILSKGHISDVLVVTVVLTVKVALNVTNVPHDVNLVLGMNWLNLARPVVVWYGEKSYYLILSTLHYCRVTSSTSQTNRKIDNVVFRRCPSELKEARIQSNVSVLKTPKL